MRVSEALHISGITLFVMLGAFGCSDNPGEPSTDVDPIEYVEPEEVGWSTEALAEVVLGLEQSGFAAMMAACDGKVFFSWGNTDYNYSCHSIRKPFLGALYGIHVGEAAIDTSATLADLSIDDIEPSLTDAEKEATVRDLLMSRSGVYHEAAAETQEMQDSRPERGSHPHGTFFYYNNWDFNALGTIFNQETRTDLYEEFLSRIADPIGMQDFELANCAYGYEPDRSEHPAYRFRMSARDMLRFGVLMQQNGTWLDDEIVPADWIAESTRSYSVMDENLGVGYGHLWSVFPEGSAMADLIGAPGYFHTGVGVHVLIVVPELKLVLVQRFDTDGEWTDPGDVGMLLGLQLIHSRVEDGR